MRHKIMMVIPSLVSGGAERVVCTLSNHFFSKGYDVVVVLFNYSNVQAYPLDENIRIVYLIKSKRNTNILHRIFLMGVTFFKLLFVLKKESPLCLLSFTTTANSWTAIICTILNIPFVVSERTTPDRTINKIPLFLQRILYFFYKRSTAVVVPSEGIVQSLKKNKTFNRLPNITVIKNSVAALDACSSGKVHSKRFIFGAGRLEYVKGFDRLIDAFSRVNCRGVDLLIAGEGSEKVALRQKIDELGLSDRVFLLGAKSNVQDYYNQCELFILPSRHEGYPNALIEAMSLGCPSIAVDCEYGPSEIIQNDFNGLLVENNDIGQLSRAIEQLLNSQNLQKTLSANALKINETNSFSAIANEWEKLVLSHA